MTYMTLTILGIDRANSSVNGNPAYELTFTNGTRARTQSDSGCAYAIGNPGMREGSRVVVRFTRAGRISHIDPAARRTNYPLTDKLENGGSVSDWLGTAMTAAEVASKWIARVRNESTNDPFGEVERAEASLVQSLEELRAVRNAVSEEN